MKMYIIFKPFAYLCKTRIIRNTLSILWNSCELFLFAFLLLYSYFDNFIFIVFIFIGILAKLYNLQDVFVYHPSEPNESRNYVDQPNIYELYDYEIIKIKTIDNLTLHSYLIKQTGELLSVAPTIVFFHGNAGNIGQRLINAKYFASYCEFNVLLVDYRGFGLSEGEPSEHVMGFKGFYMDAEAALANLYSRSDIDKNKIILYGQSIGGAVTIHSALYTKYNLFALIVENTFTTMPEIGKELFSGIPFVKLLPDFCFKNQYRSIDKVKLLTIPCCFISGSADTLVPPRMMHKLYEKCNSPFKRLVRVANGDHNATWVCPGYFQCINKFVNEITNYRKQTNYVNAQTWSI